MRTLCARYVELELGVDWKMLLDQVVPNYSHPLASTFIVPSLSLKLLNFS